MIKIPLDSSKIAVSPCDTYRKYTCWGPGAATEQLAPAALIGLLQPDVIDKESYWFDPGELIIFWISRWNKKKNPTLYSMKLK